MWLPVTLFWGRFKTGPGVQFSFMSLQTALKGFALKHYIIEAKWRFLFFSFFTTLAKSGSPLIGWNYPVLVKKEVLVNSVWQFL